MHEAPETCHFEITKFFNDLGILSPYIDFQITISPNYAYTPGLFQENYISGYCSDTLMSGL